MLLSNNLKSSPQNILLLCNYKNTPHSPLWVNNTRSKISQWLALVVEFGSPSKAISEEPVGWFVNYISPQLGSIFYSRCVHFIWLSSSLAAYSWVILLPLLHWNCSVSEQWNTSEKWSGLKITHQNSTNPDEICSLYIVWLASCIGCIYRMAKTDGAALGDFSGSRLCFLEVARLWN